MEEWLDTSLAVVKPLKPNNHTVKMRKKVYLSLIILPLLVCLVMGGGAAYMLSYSIESSTHSYAYRWKKLQERIPFYASMA